MNTRLTPELFETVACPTCKEPAGSTCVVKRGKKDRTHHIARQTKAIQKRNTDLLKKYTEWPTGPRNEIFRAICPDPEYLNIWGPRWYDHPILEADSDGSPLYVCHPYNLYGDAFKDFGKLQTNGWHVAVSGESDYYPGRTVRVVISKRTNLPKNA